MDSQGGTKGNGPHGGASRAAGAARVSPRVYRRRRIVVLVLAVVALTALVWVGTALASFVSAGFGNVGFIDGGQDDDAAPAAPSAAQSAAPTQTPEPSKPSSTSEPAAAPACADLLEVSASTDSGAYAPERNPVLTLTVTNTGEEPCSINVGTSQMEFLVTSGEDRIFSSADCQEGAEDLMRDIPAGASEEANFTWERVRSAPGCEAVEASPAPGSYEVAVSLGERTSEKSAFELQ